jgi:hypothetical protein
MVGSASIPSFRTQLQLKFCRKSAMGLWSDLGTSYSITSEWTIPKKGMELDIATSIRPNRMQFYDKNNLRIIGMIRMRFKHATLALVFQLLFNNFFILLIFVVDQCNHSGFMMMPLLLNQHLLPAKSGTNKNDAGTNHSSSY